MFWLLQGAGTALITMLMRLCCVAPQADNLRDAGATVDCVCLYWHRTQLAYRFSLLLSGAD